ncbi:putative kelch repeat [Phaeomoniella chlamydospora]|uniref:Putative kelch repeat n=1 Tax=Phaeomoniella chlamydospora TaxID=158046 RepID=A0A0G2GCL5_PHACM|nr:putative kelch repeat [Phaeomoniella chlamydospora]
MRNVLSHSSSAAMAKAKKAKSAEQKAHRAAKQVKKAAKSEKKAKTKSSRDEDSDAEEVDLDAVLAAYAEEQAKFLKVTEATSTPPSPRSSATVIASPSNRNELFVFGETKGKSPPARSGHRMTYFKNYILLFGGFQDTSQQTKYLQDLWIYDAQNFVWYNPNLPPASQKPDARSSFSFLPHDAGAVIYGGYSRVKVTSNKQGKAVAKTTLQPVIHQDTWFLRITQPDQPIPVAPTVRWEKRKKPANPPNPQRAGATMTHHRGRGILFGGVHDVEESEEGIESEFFDGLFAWNIDRNRFFPLILRRPKTGKKQQPSGSAARGRNRGKADEDELLRNLAALDAKGKLDPDGEAMNIDHPKMEEVDKDTNKISLPIRYEMPHCRFNAQITVQDDILFIFGGTVERGDQEFTFDDMYSIDLGKLDGVRELYFNEPERWNEKMEIESSDEDDDEEDDYDDDSEMSETESRATDPRSVISPTPTEITVPPSEPPEEDITEPQSSTSLSNDGRPYPRPFETLRDFFSRSTQEWQNIILEKMKYGSSIRSEEDQQTIKDLRKKAFNMAEDRWWECREEVRALEDEQEEAGIGEVVSLADRAAGGIGVGKRR